MGLGNIVKQLPLVGGMFNGPKQGIEPLDAETRGLINEGIQRSMNETPDQISQQMTAGVDKSIGQISPSDQFIQQEATRTGQNPYMLQAINNKYKGQTSSDLRKFKNQADVQAQMLKGQRMQKAAQNAFAQQQVQTNNYAMLAQSYQQNEAARSQVISSFIGLGQDLMVQNKMKSQAAQPQQMNDFASQQPIGGNSNPFGMSSDYGQF